MGTDGLKALYVLRLALKRSAYGEQAAQKRPVITISSVSPFGRPRRYVTTAYRASPDNSTSFAPTHHATTASSSTWGPRHASSDIEYPDSGEFLETSFLDDPSREESCEYRMASMTLPERYVAPIRWPYSNVSRSREQDGEAGAEMHIPRRCDTLASLVVSGDLRTARIVYDELVSLHIGILRRSIYLEPAIACIDGTPEGLEAFLFWFNLVTNRPAMRPHAAFKAAYAPLVDRLLELHGTDARAQVQVLLAAAQKGALPAIFGPIARHLAYLVPPATLVTITNSVWETFTKSTTSHASEKASSTARAAAHALSAGRRVGEGWNALVRALRAAGYEGQARQVVLDKSSIEWQDATVQGLVAGCAATEVSKVSARTADLSHLPRLVRSAHAARRGDLKAKALSALLDELCEARPSLAHRLVERYEATITDSSSETEADVGAQIRQRKRGASMPERLAHARMLAFRDLGDHAGVVERFREAFHWVGIPDQHAAGLSAGTSADSSPSQSARFWLKPSRPIKTRLYPTSVHLSTLYPSLLHLGHNTSGTGSVQALAFLQSLRHAVLADSLSTHQESSSDSALLSALSATIPTSAIDSPLADILPAEASLRPVPPQLLPMPMTFAILARKVCELYGPKVGLMMLEQNEELIGSLLKPLPGHARPTSLSGSADATSTAVYASAPDSAAPSPSANTKAPRRAARIVLTASEAATLSFRLSLARRLIPTIDVYNAVLWSLAGHTRTDNLASMLGDMYEEKPIAAHAQRLLLKIYGKEQAGVRIADLLDENRMPRPDDRTLLGVAGILEGVGKVVEAEKIREVCRAAHREAVSSA